MFLTEHFAIPGDAGFPLSGILSPPTNRDEGEQFRTYMKQVGTGVSHMFWKHVWDILTLNMPLRQEVRQQRGY